MKAYSLLIIMFFPSFIFSQQTSFDLMNYMEMKGWKKTATNIMVKYEKIDKGTGGWCQVSIYHSIASKGNVDADFNSEWQSLVVKNLPGVQGPVGDSTMYVNGWKIKAGMGSFTFNNAPCISLLTTYSAYNICMSIVANTNKQENLNEIYNFIQNVSVNKPANAGISMPVTTTTSNTNQVSTTAADGYKYNITNWEDGWISTIQPNWVEVNRGDVKVLIHFNGIPNEQYESNIMVTNKKAWDNVIVPRYTNLSNYEYLNGNMSYIPEYMMAGNLLDKNGKPVFVVLFRSGGRESNWLEFIFPNRQRFTEVFGIDKYNGYTSWKTLSNMSNYNKFAVSLSDLKGAWTNSFSGMTQYVNIYTGANAGATASSSAQEYVFDGAGNYNWVIDAASGVVGNMKFQNAKSGGKATMTSNWQMHFSNIENKPRDCNVSFSAIKGARVLWIDGKAFVRE